MGERAELFRCLATKFDRLKWTFEQPELFIAEHFASIRNEIDLDIERLIDSFRNEDDFDDSAKRTEETNSSRARFIEFLDKMEASLFVKLKNASSSSAFESFNKLEKRIEEFSTSIQFKDSNEMEEVYLKLALDIIEATNELEKHLFNNQTVAYLQIEEKGEIGCLVYLSEDFLDRDELSCLKTPYDNSIRIIHERILASLNASFAVGISRPFVLTRNTLILSSILARLKNFSEDLRGRICILEGASKPKWDLSFENNGQFSSKVKLIFDKLDLVYNSFDAVLLNDISRDYFVQESSLYIHMHANRLRRFEIADSLIESITWLDLGDNQLDWLDEMKLAKADKLRHLKLIDAFHPDTRHSLGFLPLLTELIELEITFPNAPIDFKVLLNLQKMEFLTINSSASLDSSIKRPTLTIDHFKQLSSLKKLCRLCLSYFEIEFLQKKLFSEFARLKNLQLIDNEISQIGDAVFENCFENETNENYSVRLGQNSIRSISAQMFRGSSRCRELDLSHNLIEQLPPGVFVELKNLENLFLSNNSIRHISRGALENLLNLDRLELEENLIESIEPHSFEGSLDITRLSLAENKLKSIDFLNELSEMKSIFWELKYLEDLSLKGNQLEKIDLNCFDSLTQLKYLDLSNNRISELNETIKPDVLCKLFKLDLSNNQLTRLSRHAFSQSVHLDMIKLSRNKLATLDEGFFEPFVLLSYLELQDNNLSIDITAETFSRCSRIKVINFLGNPGVRIRDGAFSRQNNLSWIRLELRDESSQNIKRILELESNRPFFSRLRDFTLVNSSIESFNAFNSDNRFKDLVYLDLKGNRIRKISRECFSSMPALSSLLIADNMIEALDDPALFQSLPNLESLILSGNNIKRIHRQVFASIDREDSSAVPQLTRLNFADNQIETLDDATLFLGLRSLEELDLSGNKLKHIHRKLFKCLSKLESLNLSNNSTLSNFDAGLFRGLFSLKELNLAGNKIASFNLSSLFQSCRVLDSLNLSNNQLDNISINEASMSGSTAQNLKQLMLANNRLDRMDFVRHLYQLEKLDLSGNKIDRVTSNGTNLLCRLVRLSHVNLSNNQIKLLDIKAIFSHLKYQLQCLDFSNNRFNSTKPCRCSTNCHTFIEES